MTMRASCFTPCAKTPALVTLTLTTNLSTHTHTHTHTQLIPGSHEKYDCEKVAKIKRLSPFHPSNTQPSRDVQMLRDVPLQGVVKYLKDHGLEPIKVRPPRMPRRIGSFTNFPQLLYTAHAVYCALEGNPPLHTHDLEPFLHTIYNRNYIRFSFHHYIRLAFRCYIRYTIVTTYEYLSFAKYDCIFVVTCDFDIVV